MKGFIELLLIALNDFTLKVLMVAAIISIVIEMSTSSDDERKYAWI